MNCSGAAVQKLNSKTETELEELYSVIQDQTCQIEVLRSRLGLVLCESNTEGCDGVMPVAAVRNSPLVDKLKQLKALVNQNSGEIEVIINTLEL